MPGHHIFCIGNRRRSELGLWVLCERREVAPRLVFQLIATFPEESSDRKGFADC